MLADQLVDAMEQELAPVPGESMSLGDIDRAVTELGKQFDTLLAEAANGDVDEYAERFRAISTTMEEPPKGRYTQYPAGAGADRPPYPCGSLGNDRGDHGNYRVG